VSKPNLNKMDWLSDIKTPEEKEMANRDAEIAKAARLSKALASVHSLVSMALTDLGRFWYGNSWFGGPAVYTEKRRWVLSKGEKKVKVAVIERTEGAFYFEIVNGMMQDNGSLDEFQIVRTDDLSEENLKKGLRAVADRGPLCWHID
jgi:hypothetical protein